MLAGCADLARSDTYAHVEGDRDEHGLPGENDEWPAEDVLEALAEGHLVALERGPVPIVSSLLPQSLRTLDQEHRTTR